MTDPDKQKKTTSRAKLSLSVNEYVRHIPTNRQYRISKLIDHTYILAADENGQEKGLKISMEYLILQERWSPLFTEEQKSIARKKLKQCGLDV